MEQGALSNNSALLKEQNGLTLVEVMIALLIFLLVFMALMQTTLVCIDQNLRNVLRDEAVQIAAQRLNGKLRDDSNNEYLGLRTISFSDLQGMATGAWTSPITVSRNFRDLTKPFVVTSRVTNLPTDPGTTTIQIEVAVGWDHKRELASQQPTNTEYKHSISFLRRQ